MNYWEQSDQLLVYLTLLGEEKAYEELVIRWQGRVIGAAAAILRDHYLAEDAAQDAFVSAWVKLDRLRDGEKFGAWVCRIARNRAKNMILRNSEMLSLDEAILSKTEAEENFDEFFSPSMDYSRLYQGISRLSERVRTVIQLHYIKGLSLAEISDQLQIPIGTVKYRLFDGREKLRKEMGISMKNEATETFVEKVMRKVEEIKLWQLKNDKNGFEVFYREVLADLALLPDTEEKHHAMADVLMRGYWWVKNEKNDELIARIRENAEKGRNETAFCTVLSYESKAFSGKELVDFMLEKQIPETQEKGFRKAEAYVWFWIGHEYCRTLHEYEKGIAAFEKILEITGPDDIHHANAKSAITMETAVREVDSNTVGFSAIAEEYRIIDGKPRYWSQPGYSHGVTWVSESSYGTSVFYYASRCDKLFYDPDFKVGESYYSGDGSSSLTFLEDHAIAQTACGTFRDCQVWETKLAKNVTYRTYYKHNIGIVRQECNFNGTSIIYTLQSYHIAGGVGLLPLCAGNRWKYVPEHLLNNPQFQYEHNHEILFFDGNTAVTSAYSYYYRTDYDCNSWEDMMLKMRQTYWKSKEDDEGSTLQDVTPVIARIHALASTPYEKKLSEIACGVMERILRTDPVFNPALTEQGHWNFFNYFYAKQEGPKRWLKDNRKFSFEWKDMKNTGLDGYPLLHNHIYSILQDAFDEVLWDESFTVGTEKIIEQKDWSDNVITTTLSVKDAGTVTTPAGAFENCILLDFHVKGRTGGWKYRGGKKEYYLAPGIGIVKAVNYYKERTRTSIYELTAYEGVGEGYFPLDAGSYRKYENLHLDKGFVAYSEYRCIEDNEGNLILLANLCGEQKVEPEENNG